MPTVDEWSDTLYLDHEGMLFNSVTKKRVTLKQIHADLRVRGSKTYLAEKLFRSPYELDEEWLVQKSKTAQDAWEESNNGLPHQPISKQILLLLTQPSALYESPAIIASAVKRTWMLPDKLERMSDLEEWVLNEEPWRLMTSVAPNNILEQIDKETKESYYARLDKPTASIDLTMVEAQAICEEIGRSIYFRPRDVSDPKAAQAALLAKFELAIASLAENGAIEDLLD